MALLYIHRLIILVTRIYEFSYLITNNQFCFQNQKGCLPFMNIVHKNIESLYFGYASIKISITVNFGTKNQIKPT